MWKLYSEKKVCGIQSVVLNTKKTALTHRLIYIFGTNIYSCLFHDANIKEENITDWSYDKGAYSTNFVCDIHM